MGGVGSGGRRPGSGRKPLDATVGAVRGSRRAKARAKKAGETIKSAHHGGAEIKPAAGGDAPEIEARIPTPPGDLTLVELAVWNELAPLAEKEGTLVDSTRMALRDLCEAIVLKRKLLRTIDDDGLVSFTLEGGRSAHPLLPQFRGLMQRVEAGMLRFKLMPFGKEIGKVEKPVDPFAEFDTPAADAAMKAH